MNQVPADRVIALLTQQLADLHRENAILTVQVQILQEQLDAPAPVAVTEPTAIPFPPPVPPTTDVPVAAAS